MADRFIKETMFDTQSIDRLLMFSAKREEIEAGINDGSIVVLTGKCYEVSWEGPHDCDCEYCDHEESHTRYFLERDEAYRFADQLKVDPNEAWNIDVDDDVDYVSAVKQHPANEGLFS